ncbi:MAG: UDP-N-acetyl-D-mannosamine dehydrogenase [Bacillota bacterium]|nr:UDP-N-acetyl-D-mannosamine dehydrogenase [Bacillota bacterium]MDW7685198.1 UDP-N-acetyl-D-mannosamine dehydrogenase [Bacillota bacterium]
MKKICVIGLGYIGLPTAAVLADSGHSVVGVDTNTHAINEINHGRIHISEPFLEEKVAAAVKEGRLRAVSVPEPADAFIIAVPTPFTSEKTADLSFVQSAAESLVPYVRKGSLVILESTVPPRTTLDVLLPVLQKSGLKVGEELLVAFCPERVLPGRILEELIHNSRVVGGVDERSAIAAKELYSSFVQGEVFTTDATTAEMTKLMENTFRDVNIALANEFALIAEKTGVNVWDAIHFANNHPRVNILQPGPGVGGHCIAVDPWFIVEQAGNLAKLIRSAREINDGMPHHVVSTIRELVAGIVSPKVALLGLTYKPNVDDCRESPALEIAKYLQDTDCQVVAYDPLAKGCKTAPLSEALHRADLLVLLVNHDEFRFINPAKVAPLVRRKVVFDTRNALDREAWESAGFSVVMLGERQKPEISLCRDAINL